MLEMLAWQIFTTYWSHVTCYQVKLSVKEAAVAIKLTTSHTYTLKLLLNA